LQNLPGRIASIVAISAMARRGLGGCPGDVGRYLSIRFARYESPYVLDFNAAANPLCNYSPHYSCPIPLKGDRHAAPIRAREMTCPCRHRDEASRLELCQCAGEMWLGPSGHLNQLGNRLRRPVPDHRQQTTVFWRQQSDDGLDRVEARSTGVRGRCSLAPRHRLHLLAQCPQALDLRVSHLDLRVSSSLSTLVSSATIACVAREGAFGRRPPLRHSAGPVSVSSDDWVETW